MYRTVEVSTEVYLVDLELVPVTVSVVYESGADRPLDIEAESRWVEQLAILYLRDVAGEHDREWLRDNASELGRELPEWARERAARLGLTVTEARVTAIGPPIVHPTMPAEFFEHMRSPGFTVVLRGYDRAQVDGQVARLLQMLALG